VSILKSLADWEQRQRDSKQESIVQSREEDGSRSLTTDETKSQDDGHNQFERAKAHKSTMEAAISEV
jgi:guanine nucleotide-exchange factor